MEIEIDRENTTFNGVKVHKFNSIQRLIAVLSKTLAIPGRNKIFMANSLYTNLFSDSPSCFVVGLAIHECEHIQRSRDMGYLWYRFNMITSSNFRYQEELKCHLPQFKYYRQFGYEFNLEERAKELTTIKYLWAVNEGEALKDLKRLWSESKY